MKYPLLVVLSLGLLSTAQAANQCKAFIFYAGEGLGPEPTQMECSSKTKSAKDCQKACAKVASKRCPKGVQEFSGTYNYMSDKTGMEAASVEGKCSR